MKLRRFPGKVGWMILSVTLLAHAISLYLSQYGLPVLSSQNSPSQAQTVIAETVLPVQLIKPAAIKKAPPPVIAQTNAISKPSVPDAATEPPTEPVTQESASSVEPAPPAPPLPSVAKTTVATPGNTSLVFDLLFGEEGSPVAKVVHDLKISGNQYELASHAEAVGVISLFYSGFIVQKSMGTVGPDGFAPTRYSEKKGDRPEVVSSMNPDTMKASLDNGKEERAYAAGLQDRLTLAYQLGGLIRVLAEQDASLQIGQMIDVMVVSTRGIEKNTFEVKEHSPISLSAGSDLTWHLQKVVPNTNKESQISIWISPSRQWLPVQVRVIDKNGLTFVQRLNVGQK